MGKLSRTKELIILLITVLICSSVITGLFIYRTQAHVDEVWSFMLSNKHDSPFLYAFLSGVGAEDNTEKNEDLDVSKLQSYEEHYWHWHDGEYYKNAVTVQPGERFAYDRVFYNQSLDVHPPFYYCILHTICSFFPNRFSWWFSYSINLVFYILTLLMIYRVSREIKLSPGHSVAAVLLWGLSFVGIGDAVFLRMYMMLSFFILLIAYLHILMIKEFRIKYAAAIFVLDLLSFLTQYYAYIAIFFFTLVYIIYTMLQKKFRRAILYGLSILASVGLAVAIFPATIRHCLGNGVYSPNSGMIGIPEVIRGFNKNLSMVIESFTGLNAEILTFIDIALIVGLFSHIIFNIMRFQKQEKITNINGETFKKMLRFSLSHDKRSIRHIWSYINDPGSTFMLISVTLAGTVIMMISPFMGTLTVRYLFIILPVHAPLIIYYLLKLLTALCGEKDVFMTTNTKKIRVWRREYSAAVPYFALILCLIGSNVLLAPSSFIKNATRRDTGFEKYFENSSMVFVDAEHHSQAFAPLMMNSERIFPADELDDRCLEVIAGYDDPDVPLYVAVTTHIGTPDWIGEQFDSKGIKYTFLGDYYCTTDDPGCHYFYKIENN